MGMKYGFLGKKGERVIESGEDMKLPVNNLMSSDRKEPMVRVPPCSLRNGYREFLCVGSLGENGRVIGDSE